MRKQYLVGLVLLATFMMGLIATTSQPSMAQIAPAQFPPGATATLLPTVIPSITPSPTIPLTPQPTSAAPGCTQALPITIGSTITVRGGVNIRTTPSVSAPLLANFPEPRYFTVLEGPVCGDNYFWWRVRGSGVNGWVAERNNAMSFILAISPSDAALLTCPEPLDLAVGEEIDLLTGVRVRNAPSLSGLVLTVAPIDSVAVVLDAEPVCAEGYNWRRVRVTVVNVVYDGYMVEGSRSIDGQFFVEVTPGPICWPPMSIAIGDRMRVYYRVGDVPKNLRAGPGETEAILFTLVRGVPVEIIGGPICVAGMNWWQVSVLASNPVDGWIAEGARGNYWLNDYDYTDFLYTPQPAAP